jgi:phage baseplate assembly protein W
MRPIANTQVELSINGFLIEDPTNETYGFVLVRDPTAVDKTTRMIQFRRIRKATDEIYEVTYYTRSTECRRCHGLKIENDFQYDSNGNLILVKNEEKLVQDIRKIVLTSLGSNPFHTWYGTSIPDLIGSKITNAGIVRSKIEGDIRTALNRYDDIQRKQIRALGNLTNASVDARERFGQLLKLDVQQDFVEPTAYNITILFSNRSSELLTVNTTLSVPDPVKLMYPTAFQKVT